YFTTAVANDGDPWTVQSGGTLKLFNVELNSSGGQTFVPLGTAYIQGNLYQYGTDAFTPNSGKVIFSNLGQREIINTQTASELEFYELEVSESSKVITSNDFNIKNEINVKANGSFIANNGTITFTGNGNIYNASNQTLIFNDLTIIGIVNTSDSWEIHGNLVVTGSLLADGGTITFKNIQEKYINNNGTLRFFKLKVADGSKLTTNTNHDFTIRNNATNPLGAGIEVEGTGEFYVGAASSNITFDVGVGVSAGNPKTIVKSDAGRLEFGVITIAANPNNEVATSSDFTITGTGANTFLNSGAGGKFTATGGTITFTGAAPEISSISPASTQFYSIRTEGPTALAVPNQAQELFVAGDFTIDGLSSMDFTANDASRVVFNGSSLQKITGNTNAVTPIQFADVTLNKTGNSELLLELNVTIASNANHELVLTNGILNLGSSTFTVGAGAMSRLNGVINGGTGTYIVAANHVTPLLEDAYFTVSGVPTLYNLTINNAHTTANDLTVNGTLDLATANLTIGSGASAVNPMKLILNGNLTRTTGLLNGSATLSRLVLQGTGTVTNGISNSYFVGTAATTVQLEVARKETLGGNLNIANGSYLRINTGINDFDLGTHTLTFNNTFNLVMISGGIKAGTGSSVVLPAAATSLPATMFRNNECYNLTIAAPITLLSDLRINGTLTGAFSITTNDNVLTFGPNATLPAYSSGSYVVGNLRRYVKNTSTKFDVGMGGKYLPVTLQFAKATSEQAIVVRSNYVNPTVGKGGDPTKPLLALWTITPEGGEINDSIKVRFEWSSTIEQIAPSSGTTFPAKWGGNSWVDYRNNIYVGSQVLYTNAYPIKGSSALNGDWAIFVADNSTDTAKDNAIKVNTLKLVITEIEPNPVVLGQAFKVTVQLQNQYGQAVTVNSPLSFNLSLLLGSGTFTSINDVIPIGQSYITLQGLSITTSAGGNHQFKVVPTVPSIDTLGSVSQLFDVLPAAPTSQATALTFTNITPTTATISWTNGGGNARIVMIKPDTLLRLNEYPQNGETYFGNTIVGLGSNLGGATVLYNGTGSSINIVGLAPYTKYYVYVFEYNGTDGNEHYRTIAAAGNPKSFETTGSYDDDVTFGPNNTRALSKAIGTNVPVRGTVKSSTDEDWFNFSVASTTPNVRVKLTNLAGDYTLEFYDTTGRRIRRSTLSGKSSEAAVVNGLPAGTYTVRIFSADGSYWTKTGDEYILQVSTYGSEIYSVTP
ncbi:MAG TPA: T9SS type A sorting domain-containing protein, partial [Candidatus Kapabacteria bacterium]|nr:T9SS type A sorting domain-containing protein [Candidatus Kapabacteria bacterium]